MNGTDAIRLVASTDAAVLAADPAFWATVALVVFFVILFWMRVPGKLLRHLDDRAQEISESLDRARDLREEAQRRLAEAERLHARSEEEASKLLERARDEARAFSEQAKRELADKLKRREETAARRLARMGEEAEARIHEVAIAAAADAAEAVLRRRMADDGAHRAHLDRTLAEVHEAMKADAR